MECKEETRKGHACAAGPLSGVRVLLVEDYADARELFAEFLTFSGAQVTTAASAREALETLECDRPDVIISDILMPAQLGIEFVRRLREQGQSVPALAATACATETLHTEALAAGSRFACASRCPYSSSQEMSRGLLGQGRARGAGHAGMIRSALGDRKRAADSLKAALDLNPVFN